MLTADTITDGQIRDLARNALTASQHKDCAVALRARREMLTVVAGKLSVLYPTTADRRKACARCAELINERAKRGATC